MTPETDNPDVYVSMPPKSVRPGTMIPGTAAAHAIISDTCRENRGDDGAIEEALQRLRWCWHHVKEGWPIGKGVKVHVVLTVERP